MKTIPVTLQLAKIFYSEFHRTNKPPVGHKKSYVAVLGDEWTKCIMVDPMDLPETWLADEHEDLRVRHDEAGDCYLYTKGQIVGICTIGRPVARWKDPAVYELTRICFNFDPKTNKERKYFSKFVRAAMFDYQLNHKVSKFVTYIHDYQSGRYLEYAGFQKDKQIKYSANDKGWATRDNRAHKDLSTKLRFIKEAA